MLVVMAPSVDLDDIWQLIDPLPEQDPLPERSRIETGIAALLEGDGSHSPFKTAAKTFLGPRGGWFHRFPGRSKGKRMNRHTKKGIWTCSSEGKYKQVCVASRDVPEQGIKKGDIKNVTQPAASKSKYNKEYKAFVAAGHERTSRAKLQRRIKAKERVQSRASGG